MERAAKKERMKFENCRASDGRIIRMTEGRYDHAIEHWDLLRDFDYPAVEIQKALEHAEEIRPEQPPKQTYIGPTVMPTRAAVSGFHFASRERRFHVVVWTEPDNQGHVITAFAVPNAPKRVGGR